VTPILHPYLVNGVTGDPVLYLEFLFAKRALLFDMGDLRPLAPRKMLRISHAFVSHAHMDHFCGFDQLLRVLLGRDKHLFLFGPPGFTDRVEHKLAAYTWNLVHRYDTDLTVVVGEVHPDTCAPRAKFRCRTGFRREDVEGAVGGEGFLVDEPGLGVRAAVLDHGTPCLAFSAEEKRHVNVWKNRVEAMGFKVGPWLRELKDAVLRDDPLDAPFRVWWRTGGVEREAHVPLGHLKAELLRIVSGQKIAYVTDVLYNEANASGIVELAQGADTLFIEAPFLDEDSGIAAEKLHLTARQAGELARRAEVRRLVPFHFSPRYTGQEDRLVREARDAFGGEVLGPASLTP
jgi:ribonuclease Z